MSSIIAHVDVWFVIIQVKIIIYELYFVSKDSNNRNQESTNSKTNKQKKANKETSVNIASQHSEYLLSVYRQTSCTGTAKQSYAIDSAVLKI